MFKALILTNSYYDKDGDGDMLVRPDEDMESVILEPWPNESNGVEIHITREELLAILDLIPMR